MKKYYFVLICFITISCASTNRYKEVPLISNDFSHEPEFWAEDFYAIGSGEKHSEIKTTCRKGEWFITLSIGAKKFPQLKYADLYGLGGGAIWELYTGDVNHDGMQDFIAALYNGSSSGSAENQLIFLIPKDDRLQLLSIWVENFTNSQIDEYYRKVQRNNITGPSILGSVILSLGRLKAIA